MKNPIRKITAVGMTAFAIQFASGAVVPEVTGVTMAQATDSRLVTINYTLSDAPAVVTVDVQTNYTENGATKWASIGGAAVANAQGNVWKQVATGSHTITWRPDLSWPDHKIADGGARAVVTAWSLDNTPDYMAVDITATGGADTQTYYPAADFVPGGVTNSLYKTTMLLMRKIMARDVTWTMGSVAESGRNVDREATHLVTLTNNYYIGVYEVTQTQWQQITGYNSSYFTVERAMRPVEQVNYIDIRQGKGTAEYPADVSGGEYPAAPYSESFLGLLRTKTRIDFDLPSEAQWEFAARAGNGEGYWADGSAMQINSNRDENLDQLGRYRLNGGKIGADSNTDPAANCGATNGTAIVGSYAPNAWGLYDVHGNVCEICLDYYADNITALNGAVNTTYNEHKVIRGGAWVHNASPCRSAFRSTFKNRFNTTGFRVVCPIN